jgi:hypothetical protein
VNHIFHDFHPLSLKKKANEESKKLKREQFVTSSPPLYKEQFVSSTLPGTRREKKKQKVKGLLLSAYSARDCRGRRRHR